MKKLAIAALAFVASALFAINAQAQEQQKPTKPAADAQAQQPQKPAVAPKDLLKPTVVALSKPLPQTLDITVGRSIIFENGTSKIQAADTDGKGQLFKEHFVQQAKVNAYYRTVRVGSGEITVTTGTK